MDGTWRRRLAILVCATMLGLAVAFGAQLGGKGLAHAAAGNPDWAGFTKNQPTRVPSDRGSLGSETAPPFVAATPALTAPIARPLVILYGDSLAWEAEDSFVGAFAGQPGVEVLTRTHGGTAICDWLDEMQDDAARLAPGAVVLEFSGNNLTPCMQDAAGRGVGGRRVLGSVPRRHRGRDRDLRTDEHTGVPRRCPDVAGPGDDRRLPRRAGERDVRRDRRPAQPDRVRRRRRRGARPWPLDADAALLADRTVHRRHRSPRSGLQRGTARRMAATSAPLPRKPSAVSSPPARSGRAVRTATATRWPHPCSRRSEADPTGRRERLRARGC